MKKYLIVLAIFVVAGMFSCTKIGPMGPQGEPGRNGFDGNDGEDGTMPVVYYFDVQLNNFIYESYNESWNAYSYLDDFEKSNNLSLL